MRACLTCSLTTAAARLCAPRLVFLFPFARRTESSVSAGHGAVRALCGVASPDNDGLGVPPQAAPALGARGHHQGGARRCLCVRLHACGCAPLCVQACVPCLYLCTVLHFGLAPLTVVLTSLTSFFFPATASIGKSARLRPAAPARVCGVLWSSSRCVRPVGLLPYTLSSPSLCAHCRPLRTQRRPPTTLCVR